MKRTISKYNYNIFSKKELILFLVKYEKMFRMIDIPFDIMIDSKMELIMQKINAVNKDSEKLYSEYETVKDKFAYAVKISENHKKWDKLNKEYDKLSELRFGKNS